ncbi:MAG: HAMP domain-containing protein, partial [bacterium]
MTLRAKELGFSLAVIASAGGIILILSVRSARRAILREVVESQLARVAEAAARLPEGVRRRDERRLLPVLQSIQARAGGPYAAVLDRDGVVLGHTNVVEVGKRWADAVTRSALAREEPGAVESVYAGEPVLDVVVPVREAEEEYMLAGSGGRAARLGTLRFGVPLRKPFATVRQIGFNILWIILAVALFATVAVVAFIHRILAPVRLLAEGTERIARGDYAVDIPVRSRDEFGSLARRFNRM